MAEKQKDTQCTGAEFNGQQRPNHFPELRGQTLERHGEHTEGQHGANKGSGSFEGEQEGLAGFSIHPRHIGIFVYVFKVGRNAFPYGVPSLDG